jgi:hypothetical protein
VVLVLLEHQDKATQVAQDMLHLFMVAVVAVVPEQWVAIVPHQEQPQPQVEMVLPAASPAAQFIMVVAAVPVSTQAAQALVEPVDWAVAVLVVTHSAAEPMAQPILAVAVEPQVAAISHPVPKAAMADQAWVYCAC